MHKYKDLKIWQRAMGISEKVYELSQGFPDEERFGLKSQIRRAVVSIPSNIAEGAGRKTDMDFSRFLDMANGSINEVETQLLLSQRLKILEESESFNWIISELDELQKMIFSFQSKLKTH
tara:strand:+ start:396 stop:755 length:360 start_codon:yes stop_codon:yes gene_type:complete